MYTKFGEFVRILRIKRHESQEDMARKLDVSRSFLSNIENGDRGIPSSWTERISSVYDLSDEDRSELKDAIDESNFSSKYKINVSGAGEIKKKVARSFAESFDKMDDEKASKILQILNEE